MTKKMNEIKSRKINGKMTDRAKMASLYESVIDGSRNTNRFHFSYLMRVIGRSEKGMMNLLRWFKNNTDLNWTIDGRHIIFITTI